MTERNFDEYYRATRRALTNARAACLFIKCEREHALEIDAELIETIRSSRSRFTEAIKDFHELRNSAGNKLVAEQCAALIIDLEQLAAALAEIDDDRILLDGIF